MKKWILLFAIFLILPQLAWGATYTVCASGCDANISSDPLFVSAGTDFHLTASSPAKSAGTNLNLNKDFDNVNVPDMNISMGAYQYYGFHVPAQ